MHAARMAEAPKALLAVIGAHAAWANAAKRQVILHAVNKRAVERHAARCRAVQNPFAQSFVLAVAIKRQRTILGVDETDGAFKIVIADDRKHRSEYFLAHQQAILRRVHDDRRPDLARSVDIVLVPEDLRAERLGFLDRDGDALAVSFADE